MNEKTLKNAIFTLHRYYIWANIMRVQMESKMPVYVERMKSNPENFVTEEWIEFFLYMSYWYAGLYVVVEGWQELKLSDSRVDPLLQSPNVGLLKRYRHGVFHFQRDYFDERFISFMRDGQNAADWVRRLNQAFGRYFLLWHRDNKTQKAQPKP